jgi:hypothetical protein
VINIRVVAYIRWTKTPRKFIIVRKLFCNFFYIGERCDHSEGGIQTIQVENVREYGGERDIWGLRGIR